MSVKVHQTNCPEQFPLTPFSGRKNTWIATHNLSFFGICTIDGIRGQLHCNIYEGCLLDGASNPLRIWPIKRYYGIAKKDLCWIWHDVGYNHKGYVRNLHRRLVRDEVDDLLRGSFREAGEGRIPAALVDIGVFFGGAGKKHWGDDSLHARDLCELCWIPLENKIPIKD